MKFLFVFLIALAAIPVSAQSNELPTILQNVKVGLTRIGLINKVHLEEPSAGESNVSARFLTPEDKAFALNKLKDRKNFKESNGLMLFFFHRGAKKSFRELSAPSMHVIWYENKIEIHYDMHCPGFKSPISSYRHFREVVVNWMYRSTTSQRRVAVGLENVSKEENINQLPSEK